MKDCFRAKSRDEVNWEILGNEDPHVVNVWSHQARTYLVSMCPDLVGVTYQIGDSVRSFPPVFILI